jgi:hypothetical protein
MIDGRNDMQQSCSQSQQNDIITDFTKFDIYVFISVNVANLFLVYLSKFISIRTGITFRLVNKNQDTPKTKTRSLK